MAVLYTPHFIQFFDDDGAPLAGGKLYAYEAGTTTPKDTYTTAAGSIANANPVILDAAGRATVFLSGSYKFVLKDSADVEIETTDNISAFASSISGGVSNITADYTDTAVATGDSFVFSDVSDSGNTKRDTIQGIMDLYILDEDAMTSNSATQVPSQQSVKAYVDNNDIVVQRVYASIATSTSSAGIQIPLDDTIPQNTEGLEAITLAITPTSATNRLRIRAIVNGASSGSNQTHIAALFQGSTANALQVAAGFEAIGNNVISIPLQYEMVAGTTSATTFKIRMGSDSSTTYTLNGASAARLFGGVMAHTMVIEEILA